MERRKPLRIDVPREDRPRLGRVAAIAVVGFVVGVSWPHLAGVHIVPRAPTPAGEAASDELSGAPAPSAEAAQPKAEAPPVEAEKLAPALPHRFTIGEGEVTSCRSSDGKRLSRCDKLDFDVVARGRLATLAACDASARARGVLSVGFDLDFERDRVVGIQTGKSTTVADSDARTLIGCLNETLGEVSLASIPHESARYTVFYRVEFRDPAEPVAAAQAAGDAAPNITPASGRATVGWDVALVREGPSRDDDVVARVLQGTRVTVTGRKGDWYRVKYDGKGSEGWVFRTALGM